MSLSVTHLNVYQIFIQQMIIFIEQNGKRAKQCHIAMCLRKQLKKAIFCEKCKIDLNF